MCVIAYMPKNKRLSDSDVFSMYMSNSDGAGIMYPLNDNVVISKGFFDVEELIKEYNSIPNNTPLVMHCRIATSGGISERTCHPFAISETLDGLVAKYAKFGVAHNGVLSGMGNNKVSDTQEYITHVLAPLQRMTCAKTVKELDSAAGVVIESTIQKNRLAIMDASGCVALYGKWHNYKGCKISNNHFKSFKAHKLPFEECAACMGRYDCEAFGAFCENKEDVIDSFNYYAGGVQID